MMEKPQYLEQVLLHNSIFAICFKDFEIEKGQTKDNLKQAIHGQKVKPDVKKLLLIE